MWTSRRPETVAGRMILVLTALVMVAVAYDVFAAHLPTHGVTMDVIAVLTACMSLAPGAGHVT